MGGQYCYETYWKRRGHSLARDCYFGESASAFIKLAKAFGYTPVWSNTINLMWVQIDQAIELNMIIPSVESFPGPYTRLLHPDCNG